MNLSSSSMSHDPDTLVTLTREYGAYGRERSGLGLLLGEFLLGCQTGLIVGLQLGWALAQIHRDRTSTWLTWLSTGKALGHPLFVLLMLLPPILWLAGKEYLRRRYLRLESVRISASPAVRRRLTLSLILMGFVSLVILLVMPLAWQGGWNSSLALASACGFAVLFPLACWRWTAPGLEALVGLVFLLLVSLTLVGAQGAYLLGLATMTLPAAFLGGLEGLMQHMEFKELEQRLAGAGREP